MLTKIDELNLADHYYLEPADECYFIGEYTAGRGYAHSATNQLIYNLKKSVDRRGLAEYRFKEEAIAQAGYALSQFLNPTFIQNGTFVPIPPSKSRDDPLYDDRISRVIRSIGVGVEEKVGFPALPENQIEIRERPGMRHALPLGVGEDFHRGLPGVGAHKPDG